MANKISNSNLKKVVLLAIFILFLLTLGINESWCVGCNNDSDCSSTACCDTCHTAQGVCVRDHDNCGVCKCCTINCACENCPSGSDPKDECPAKSCNGYYDGWHNSLTCYECGNTDTYCNGGSCETTAEVCGGKRCDQGSDYITCDCTREQVGCSGKTAGSCNDACHPKVTINSPPTPNSGDIGVPYNITIEAVITDIDANSDPGYTIDDVYFYVIEGYVPGHGQVNAGDPRYELCHYTDVLNGTTLTCNLTNVPECIDYWIMVLAKDGDGGVNAKSRFFATNCYPDINAKSPLDGDTGIELDPTLSADITDAEDHDVNWSLKSVSPDPPGLQVLDFHAPITDPTSTTATGNYNERLCYKLWYEWNVSSHDSIMADYSRHEEEKFTFETEQNFEPTVTLVSPPNGALTSSNPLVQVNVADPNGDQMNVTFYLNGNPVGTMSDVLSGITVPMFFPNLNPSSSYEWYVYVCDTHCEYCMPNFGGPNQDCQCTNSSDVFGPWSINTSNSTGLTELVLNNSDNVYDHTANYTSLHEKYWFTFNASKSYDTEGDVLNYSWDFDDGDKCWTNLSAPFNCSCTNISTITKQSDKVFCADLNGDTVITGNELPGWDVNKDGEINESDCMCIDANADGDFDKSEGALDRNGDGVNNISDCTFASIYSGCADLTGPGPNGESDGTVDEWDYDYGNYADIYGDRNLDGVTNISDCKWVGSNNYYTSGDTEPLADRCVVVKHKYNHTRGHVYVVNLTVTDNLSHSTSLSKDLAVRALMCDEPGVDPHDCCAFLPGYNKTGTDVQKKNPCEAELDEDCRYIWMTRQKNKCPSMNVDYGCVANESAAAIDPIPWHDPKLACYEINVTENQSLECTQFASGCKYSKPGPFTNTYYTWQCEYAPSKGESINEKCLDASPTQSLTPEELACCKYQSADPCNDNDVNCTYKNSAGNLVTVNVDCTDEEACNCTQFVKDNVVPPLPGGDSSVGLDNWSGCDVWKYIDTTSMIPPYQFCRNDNRGQFETEQECLDWANDPRYKDPNCDCNYYPFEFNMQNGCSIKGIIDSVQNMDDSAKCVFNEKVTSSNWLLNLIDSLDIHILILSPIAWLYMHGSEMYEIMVEVWSDTLEPIVLSIQSIQPCNIACLEKNSSGDITCQNGIVAHVGVGPNIACTIEVDRTASNAEHLLTGSSGKLTGDCTSSDLFERCRVGVQYPDGSQVINCNFSTQRCTCQDTSEAYCRCLNTTSGDKFFTSNCSVPPLNEINCTLRNVNKEGDMRSDLVAPGGICDIGEEITNPFGNSQTYEILGYAGVPTNNPHATLDCNFTHYEYEYSEANPCTCPTGEPLAVKEFPLDGQMCTAIYSYRGLLVCDRFVKEYGFWDTSEDKCVQCDHNLETVTIANGTMIDTRNSEIFTGNALTCEAACGADPYCDEVKPFGVPDETYGAEPECYGPMIKRCDVNCKPATSSICYSNKYKEDGSPVPGPVDTDSSCYTNISPGCQLKPPGTVCKDSSGDPGICSDKCECISYAEYYNFQLKPGVSLISYPLLESENMSWLGTSYDLCQNVPNLRGVEKGESYGMEIAQYSEESICGNVDTPLLYLQPDVSYLLDIAGANSVGFTLWGKTSAANRKVTMKPGWNWFGFTSFISRKVGSVFIDPDEFPYIYEVSPECDLNRSEVIG